MFLLVPTKLKATGKWLVTLGIYIYSRAAIGLRGLWMNSGGLEMAATGH